MIITAEKNKEISEKLSQAVTDGMYVVKRGNSLLIGCDTSKAQAMIDDIMAKTPKERRKL